MTDTAQNDTAYHNAKWRRTAILVALLAGVFTLALPHRDDAEEPESRDRLNSAKPASKDQLLQTLAASFGSRQADPQTHREVTDELRALESTLQDADAGSLAEQLPAVREVLSGLQKQTTWPLKPSRSKIQALAAYVNQTLTDRAQRDQDHQDNLVRKAREVARSESRVEIAQAQALLQTEIERQASLKRQLEVQQVKADALGKRNSRQAALQRDRAEVDSLLKPFTSPGHYQPASRSNAWDMEWTVDPMPVSLSRLDRLGALEKSPAGLLALYIVGGAKAPGASHDRPLGTFPQCWAGHLEKPKIRDAVLRAQELLRMHGAALVEQGLLTQ